MISKDEFLESLKDKSGYLFEEWMKGHVSDREFANHVAYHVMCLTRKEVPSED